MSSLNLTVRYVEQLFSAAKAIPRAVLVSCRPRPALSPVSVWGILVAGAISLGKEQRELTKDTVNMTLAFDCDPESCPRRVLLYANHSAGAFQPDGLASWVSRNRHYKFDIAILRYWPGGMEEYATQADVMAHGLKYLEAPFAAEFQLYGVIESETRMLAFPVWV